VELAHHHRPDNAVLPAAAAEIGHGAQVAGQDLKVFAVGRRQQAKHPFQMVKSRHYPYFLKWFVVDKV
jgi:hypothetical protein